MEQENDRVTLERVHGYRFKITFPDSDKTTLMMDEPPPLGELKGPNAARVLAASVLNCLSASLLFCLEKSKIEVKEMRGDANPIVERNKEGYWRVARIDIFLYPKMQGNPDPTRIKRCLDIFEKYCVVTGAVRNGLQVEVKVNPS
jgi:uncharacterized OsmC-like protein